MRVLCFSPYTSWLLHTAYDAVIQHGLSRRGAVPLHVLCDGVMSTCDLFTERSGRTFTEEACRNCQTQSAQIVHSLGLSNVTWLGRFASPTDRPDAQRWAASVPREELLTAAFDGYSLGEWTQSSVKTKLRLSYFNTDDPSVETALRVGLADGLVVARAYDRLLDAYEPHKALMMNGRLAPTRIALELCRRRSIDCFMHERAFNGYTQLRKNNSTTTRKPVFDYWEKCSELPLTESECLSIDRILKARFAGGGMDFRNYSPAADFRQSIEERFEINNGNGFFVAFTTSGDELENIDVPKSISGHRDWISKLIRFFSKNPSENLIIRVHPNIKSKDSQGANQEEYDYFSNVALNLPHNVKLIKSDEIMSPYALMRSTKGVFTYVSTAGVEAVALGKKVLQAACLEKLKSDFLLYLDDNDFDEQIKQFINYQNKKAIEDATYAWRFLYAELYRFNAPFSLIDRKTDIDIRFNFKSVNDLVPGYSKELDDICDMIMLDKPVNEISEDDAHLRSNGIEVKIIEKFLDEFSKLNVDSYTIK